MAVRLSSTVERTEGRELLFRSPLRYPGGKQKALSQIAQMLPAGPVAEYREVMVGGGSLFFWLRSHDFAGKYWINDKFEELVSFWEIVQDPVTCARLQKDLEKLRRSFRDAAEIKEYFLKARREHPEDPYRTALLFFFFNRVTFSGTTRAGGFSASASTARFTASSIERLAKLPQALQDVRITSLGFENVVRQSGRDVFLFLDPPYFKASRLYGRNGALHEFDHEALSHMLRKTKHRFLITYDDCEEVRKLYEWATVKSWSLQYGMNNCGADNVSKIGSELFIYNY